MREARLNSFLDPIIGGWQNNDLSHSLTSFNNFCSLLGLGDVQLYLKRRAANEIQDWTTNMLDEDGKLLQSHMRDRLEVSVLPKRRIPE